MALTRLHSMRDFFRVWFTWKKQAGMVFLIIVAVIMFFAYAYTPDYTSTAKIMILPHTTGEIVISAGESQNRILPVETKDINTEIELLKSDDVIRETVRSFESRGGMGLGLKDKAWYENILDVIKKTRNKILLFFKLKEKLAPFEANVATLRQSLKVEPVAMSNIILVKLSAKAPKAAANVLNRLLEIYIQKHNNAFSKEEGVNFLSKEAASYHNKLEDAEKKSKEMQKKWNIVDSNKQKEANIRLLAELTQDLKRNELDYVAAKSRIDTLKESINSGNELVITREMRTIPAIIELEKNIIPLLVSRSETMKHFLPASREYKNLENQIAALQGEVKNEILKAVQSEEMELEIMEAAQKSRKEQISTLQEETSKLNQRERILVNLEREIDLLKNNYMLYASKTEDARIYREQKKQDLANVYIADQGEVPLKPSFPNRFLLLLISLFVGFFASLGTPFFLEFLDHRLKTPGEVEDLISLPVVCFLSDEK